MTNETKAQLEQIIRHLQAEPINSHINICGSHLTNAILTRVESALSASGIADEVIAAEIARTAAEIARTDCIAAAAANRAARAAYNAAALASFAAYNAAC